MSTHPSLGSNPAPTLLFLYEQKEKGRKGGKTSRVGKDEKKGGRVGGWVVRGKEWSIESSTI